MATSKISASRSLPALAALFATFAVGFGVNALLRPSNAITFFELEMPTSSSEQLLVNTLLAVYGVRDIFMGVATYAALWFGSRKALGVIVVALGMVAFADGAICRIMVGRGEWNHWGLAPVAVGAGACLLGLLDGA